MNLPLEICAIINSYAPYFRIDTPRIWYYFCIHCKREMSRLFLPSIVHKPKTLSEDVQMIQNVNIRQHDCKNTGAFHFNQLARYNFPGLTP